MAKMTTDEKANLSKVAQNFLFQVEYLEGFQSDLDRFATKFAADAAYAFEWADDAMTAAANVAVAKLAKQMLAEWPVDVCVERMTTVVVAESACPAFSTSPVSNVMKQRKLAAMASLVRARF
jgi:hypothetical protein